MLILQIAFVVLMLVGAFCAASRYEREKIMTARYSFLLKVFCGICAAIILARITSRPEVKYHCSPVLKSVYEEAYTGSVDMGQGEVYDIYHPPTRYITDCDHNRVTIDEDKFSEVGKKLVNKTISQGTHLGQRSVGDGSIISYLWDHQDASLIPCFTYTYTQQPFWATPNASSKIDAKKFGLYEFPKIKNFIDLDVLLGFDNLEASNKIKKWNATSGNKKDILLIVMVFKDKPETTGTQQAKFWQNQASNVLGLCVGVDGENHILWKKAFSKSAPNDLIHAIESCIFLMRNYELNLNDTVSEVTRQIDSYFVVIDDGGK